MHFVDQRVIDAVKVTGQFLGTPAQAQAAAQLPSQCGETGNVGKQGAALRTDRQVPPLGQGKLTVSRQVCCGFLPTESHQVLLSYSLFTEKVRQYCSICRAIVTAQGEDPAAGIMR